jgi:hypothetical protein
VVGLLWHNVTTDAVIIIMRAVVLYTIRNNNIYLLYNSDRLRRQEIPVII